MKVKIEWGRNNIWKKNSSCNFQATESTITKNLKQINKRKMSHLGITHHSQRGGNKLLRLAIYKTHIMEEKKWHKQG